VCITYIFGTRNVRCSFLSTAKEAGLDTDDHHMQELYDYIRLVLP